MYHVLHVSYFLIVINWRREAWRNNLCTINSTLSKRRSLVFAGSIDGYVSRSWSIICLLFAFFLLILYVCSPILPDFYQSLPATKKFYFLDEQLSFFLVCLLFSFFFFVMEIHNRVRWDRCASCSSIDLGSGFGICALLFCSYHGTRLISQNQLSI